MREADVAKHLSKCKVRSRCGDDASSSRETGTMLYSVRRRGRTPLATAARLTSFGGYFATPASHYPLPSTNYQSQITNRKSQMACDAVQRATTRAYPSSDRFAAHFVRGIFRHSRSALPTINYPLPSINYQLPIYPLSIANHKSINRKFYHPPSANCAISKDSIPQRTRRQNLGGNKELCLPKWFLPWRHSIRNSYQHPSRGHLETIAARVDMPEIYSAFRPALQSRQGFVE